VDLPVPLGPKIKKLPAGGAKNLSVNFSIGLPQDECFRLNLRLNFTLLDKICKEYISHKVETVETCPPRTLRGAPVAYSTGGFADQNVYLISKEKLIPDMGWS
jgi:hypothetical protein